MNSVNLIYLLSSLIIYKKTAMSSSPRNFYNGWTDFSNNEKNQRRGSLLRRSNSNESLEDDLLNLEKEIYHIQKDVEDIKDELTLVRFNTRKVADYLKDIQKLNVYERELQLLQIKNVILETVPNMITQIVPEIVRSSFSREEHDYQEEEMIPASHIQDISNKTSILVCSEPFLCSICHNNVEKDQVIRKIDHCSHSFHINCLETWLGEHNNCPLCRFQI